MITIEDKKWLSPLRSARFVEMSLSELQKQDFAQGSAESNTIGRRKRIPRYVVLDSLITTMKQGFSLEIRRVEV